MTDALPEISLAEFTADDDLMTEAQAVAELRVRQDQLPPPVGRIATGAKPKVYRRDAIRELGDKLSNPDVYEYVPVHRGTGELLSDYQQH